VVGKELTMARRAARTTHRRALLLGALAATLLIAGCATAQGWRWDRWPPYGLREQPPGTCDAARATQALVGQQPSEALLRQARSDSGAQVVRVLRHDQVVTREFQAGRLNLRLNESGAIAEVTCG
jgi:hypothetical protein